MMASLYQSSSPSSEVTGSSVSSIDDSRFMARASRQAAKEQGGIAHRIDPQAEPAPFERVAFAGDHVLDRGDVTAIAGHADLDIAERQPEFVHLARQRDGGDDAVGLVDRFLDEGDDVAVVDGHEAE